MDGLTFREEDHQYFYNGRKVPGVTEAIGEFVYCEQYDTYVHTFTGTSISGNVFSIAGDHGRAVHDAVKYDLTCGVVYEDLHDDIRDALDQYRLWKDEYVREVISVEEMAYSQKYGYCGTWDQVVELKKKYGGKRCLVDIKTGAHGMSGPQTAAYENLYKEKSKYRGKILRAVIELPKTGDSFKFIPKTERHDWNTFKACLVRYCSV